MNQPEAILKQYFGYDTFRPLQKDIVESVLAGKDTIALLPTGGGKSVCFQVPALMMEGICIVVTPLVALMKDQVENLRNRDIMALALYGGMSRREIEFELENCINGKYKFLYVSPERLQSKNFCDFAINMRISFIAVDEAHCISQWGYDFRPPYLKITEFKERFQNMKVCALTASATPDVIDDIAAKLALKKTAVFKKSFTRDNLSYVVEECEHKLDRIKTICEKVKGSGLVYVKSRKKTADIAEYLSLHNISADYYHAGLDPKLRTIKQDDWKAGRTRIMVCTNAFGMGIDKPNVRLVVHEQKPDTMEAYYQEAGRAGRDGKRAYCVLLYFKGDFLEDDKQLDNKYPNSKEIVRVYELICNYLQVAVGSGSGMSYDFNINEFCAYYKLNPVQVFNCIRILEAESYFQASESMYLPSRMKILLSYTELYEWQIRHESVDALVKVLLRSYGGLFDFYTNIFENEIARRIKKPEKWVKDQLLRLHELELIDYIPQNHQAQLQFLENRFSSIYIADAKIDFLRQRYRDKLQLMNQYLTNQNTCRSKFLVQYFGETTASDCGYCDICLTKKAQAIAANPADQKLTQLTQWLKAGPMNTESLKSASKASELEEYLILLRWLTDKGEVILTAEGNWVWKSNKK